MVVKKEQRHNTYHTAQPKQSLRKSKPCLSNSFAEMSLLINDNYEK